MRRILSAVAATLIATMVSVHTQELAPVPAARQAPTAAAKNWNPPRTPDGQPDIQGYWTLLAGDAFPQGSLEGIMDPAWSLGRPPGNYKSVVVDPADGKIPYQPWALAKKNDNFANHLKPTKRQYLDGRTLCHLPGAPRDVYSGAAEAGVVPQIIQTPGYVVMMIEFVHAFRLIPLDGRPHVGENIQLWQGDSRGHWEGNTLVVDVTNANGKWLDVTGDFHSDALHVVERWTFVDADTLGLEVTMEDPKVYTRRWKMAFTLTRNKEKDYEMMEYACVEGERDAQRMLQSTGK